MKKILYILANFFLFTTACTGPQGIPGPAGDVGTVLGAKVGKVEGFVGLGAENGSIETNFGGVTITIEGTNPLITATSNAAGKFDMSNVPVGTYALKYEKMGYTTNRNPLVTVAGGYTPVYVGNTPLFRTISLNPTSLTATISGINVSLQGALSGATTTASVKGLRVFFHDTNNVNTNNQKYTTTSSIGVGFNAFTWNIPLINFFRFPTGTTVYAVVHTTNSDFTYSNLAISQLVYPFISTPSPVASFVMP